VHNIFASSVFKGWLVGWGLTALLTQNRSYRACKFVGIFKEFINVNMRRVLVSSMTVIFIIFYCQLVKVTVAEHDTVITMSC